ncbi:MAG: proprotein convertase P-domain-containing protein [Planctomycetota bacterium]
MRTKRNRSVAGGLVKAQAVCVLIVVFVTIQPASAEPAPLYARMQPVALDSGRLNNPRNEPAVVFSQVIDLGPDVPWFRVLFDKGTSLAPGSYIRVTSLLDGETQTLDAEQLRNWNYGTAFFNGSKIAFELLAAGGAAGNALKVSQVFVGEIPPTVDTGGVAAICAGTNNRAHFPDSWDSQAMGIGRLLPGTIASPGTAPYCTAFMIARPSGTADTDKVHLTAGHCFDRYGPYKSTLPPDSIPDGVGYVSHKFTLPPSTAGTVSDVDVDLSIIHTWVGDLIVKLEHRGTTVVLINRPRNGTGDCDADNYDGIRLDDTPPPTSDGGNVDAQCVNNLTSLPRYRPSQALSAFNGLDRAGDWTLTVSDVDPGESGSFVGWTLYAKVDWTLNLPDDYILQFNVYCDDNPLRDRCSNANCTITHPRVEDQFPVRRNTVISSNRGRGDDWAVFRCGPNEDGDTSWEHQVTPRTPPLDDVRWAFPLAGVIPDPTQVPAPSVRVTGYGVDGTEVGGDNDHACTCPSSDPPTGRLNATAQTATGQLLYREVPKVIGYDADACRANSGSPVFNAGEIIGIVTDDESPCPPGRNYGTAVTHLALKAAIESVETAAIIPAVSTWGLLVLALLTATAGTLVLRRRLLVGT